VDQRRFETLLAEVIQRHSLVLYALFLMPKEALFVGRELGGIGLTQAAKYLRRDPSAMSLALKRLQDRFATDSDQCKRVEHLRARLRQGRRRKYQISKGTFVTFHRNLES
jgi:hypothetical protein